MMTIDDCHEAPPSSDATKTHPLPHNKRNNASVSLGPYMPLVCQAVNENGGLENYSVTKVLDWLKPRWPHAAFDLTYSKLNPKLHSLREKQKKDRPPRWPTPGGHLSRGRGRARASRGRPRHTVRGRRRDDSRRGVPTSAHAGAGTSAAAAAAAALSRATRHAVRGRRRRDPTPEAYRPRHTLGRAPQPRATSTRTTPEA